MNHRTVGFLGAGAIATALAGHVLRTGRSIILSNSRGPRTLESTVTDLGDGAHTGSRFDAAAADIVVLAVPWNRIGDTLHGLPDFDDTIIIDTTNPLFAPHFAPVDLDGHPSSIVVQAQLRGGRLVKAFNTLPPHVLATDPLVNGARRVIFMCGDHPVATDHVADLTSQMGFAPVNLGTLDIGGALQNFPGGPLPTLNLVRIP